MTVCAYNRVTDTYAPPRRPFPLYDRKGSTFLRLAVFPAGTSIETEVPPCEPHHFEDSDCCVVKSVTNRIRICDFFLRVGGSWTSAELRVTAPVQLFGNTLVAFHRQSLTVRVCARGRGWPQPVGASATRAVSVRLRSPRGVSQRGHVYPVLNTRAATTTTPRLLPTSFPASTTLGPRLPRQASPHLSLTRPAEIRLPP